MEEVVINFSKKKVGLLCFAAIIFVILGFYLFQIADTQTVFNSSFMKVFTKISSIIAIIFFGFASVYALIKLFDNKPALVINENGIIDNSSSTSAGLIKWENIVSISITEIFGIFGQKILSIEINNADEIITKQGILKKILMKLNNNFYKSPIQISSNALECNFQELYSILKEQLSSHRANSNG